MKNVWLLGQRARPRSTRKGSTHMKRTIQGFLVAGTLLIGGSALAQQEGKAQKGTAQVRGFVVPTDEKAFLERLHYINQMEIKLGQLAQQNSTNPDVKSFGESMVREHTDADKKLLSLAQGRGLKLSDTPKPMNDMEKKSMAADKAIMEELQTLKGEPFDSCYMANQVGDHDDALGKLMAGRQAITGNAQFTSLLDDMTQHVSQHRQQAYSVLGKLGQGMMGVGGAGDTQKGTGGHMDTHQGGGHMGTGTGGSTGTGSGTQPKK
jgi:putative membrane protein